MQRSGTSREFTMKRQGHIHNYVYKPGGYLARLSGWTETERSKMFRGFLEIWPRLKKRDLGLPKRIRV
jgi:hypothetical protein